MKAYIIVEIDVHDPALYEEYKKLTPASLIPFHGKFIVRGGETLSLEGDWNPGRIVVLEFPSEKLARAWWHSGEYSAARAIRQRAAHTRMIMVSGTSV